MCGIAGFVYFDGRPVDRAVVRKMSDAQSHRGPDESGCHVGQEVALGHRRLSIIDLASGQQPLCNEDGTVWISFNGEVYNFLELNRELQNSHVFRTHSDTETIVHLYESNSEGFVSKLRGMFAFALWDDRRKTMILARDRVGKKPLYYYQDSHKLVFASEIKSILEHPDLDRSIDDQAVCDYFSLGYIPAPKSIYRRIRKVLPGHFLKISKGHVQDVEYWDIRFANDVEWSEAEWQERLNAEFRTAVDIRLMSEVPLGAFLSGGLDSSSVVAMMQDILRQPVRTATIGFQEDAFDESGFASQVSKHLGTDHYAEQVTPDKIETIEKLVWHYDEPFSDSSALPTYYVSQAARSKVTVALSGDGGDENFAGYRRYYFDRLENQLRSVLPLSVRKPVFGPLGRLYPKLDWAPRFLRAKATFQSLSYDPIEGYFETMSTFRSYEKPSLMSPDFRASVRDYESIDVFREYYNRAGTVDPLSRIQYVDIKTYLTDDILTKVDRASMAHSLEVRCPLLDHKFMELVASMPSDLKLRGKTGKYIFKKLMKPRLPEPIVHRTKMGFSIPLAEWFRGGIREYAYAQIFEGRDSYFSRPFLQKMWDQHQAGIRDRSSQLWNVLMFRAWYRRFACH